MRRVAYLDEYVSRRAQRTPEALAVRGDHEGLSYGELDERSNRIARLLREAGCGAGELVLLLTTKSPTAVAALLAAYKAGGMGVPLDAGNPTPRLGRILARCQGRFLVAGSGVEGRLQELAAGGHLEGTKVIQLEPAREEGPSVRGAGPGYRPDFTEADVAGQDAGPLPTVARPEGAHVLFTSGSTGDPKGVVVRHESVVRFVEWAVRHFRIEPGERLSGHAPLHFDLSTFDLFGAFAAGAELHLVPPDLHLLPRRLARFIRDRRLTQWFSVPSILCYLAHLDAVEQDDFPSLRRLLWCGEPFPVPSLVHFMKRLPHVAFTNLYGPTEATIASSYHDVPPLEELRGAVPIGKACDGEALHVVDDELRQLGNGQVGELAISGVGLSPGYYRDPERTAAVFVSSPDPSLPERIYRTGDLAWRDERGLVHLVGRIDSQIKSRGYRIELGEIENAIAATGLAREAVVTAVATGGFEGQSICCAYVPVSRVDPARLRKELHGLLPSYMIPSRWSVRRRIPRNANGKLDRRRVRESFEKVADVAAAP